MAQYKLKVQTITKETFDFELDKKPFYDHALLLIDEPDGTQTVFNRNAVIAWELSAL